MIPLNDGHVAIYMLDVSGHGVAAALLRGGDLQRSPRGAMAATGWAVAPGQRFRIAAPPGVRISFARLAESDAPAFAAEFARALRHRASRLD